MWQFVKESTNYFLAFLLLLIVVSVGFVWYLLNDIHGRHHESDEVLETNLLKNMKKYETLVSMFLDDYPIEAVHPQWTRPDRQLDPDRWDEYRSLFDELALDAGIRSYDGKSIVFTSTSQGLVTGGSSKGYVYKPVNPSPLFSNLNQIPKGLPSNVRGYKRINDSWYIYFEWDD